MHSIIIIINGINKMSGNSNDGSLSELRDAAIAVDNLLINDPSNSEEIHEALEAVQTWVTASDGECDNLAKTLSGLLK